MDLFIDACKNLFKSFMTKKQLESEADRLDKAIEIHYRMLQSGEIDEMPCVD